MDAFWLALQESGYGSFIRNSVFFYPAANVLHVLGVMSFFGLVATMDLALLGVGQTPARQVIRRLRPFAVALLVLIAATGSVLFVAEAVAIAANPVFQLKVVLILLALANVVGNELVLAHAAMAAPSPGSPPGCRLPRGWAWRLWAALSPMCD